MGDGKRKRPCLDVHVVRLHVFFAGVDRCDFFFFFMRVCVSVMGMREKEREREREK